MSAQLIFALMVSALSPCQSHQKKNKIKLLHFLNHANRRIDRYIRAKRKLIALLNEQKQVIIQQAVARGLDPNVRLRPSDVEWLGGHTEHWAVISLRHLAESLQTGPFGSQLHS